LTAKTIIIRAEDRAFKGQGHRSRAEAIYQACQKAGLSTHILISDRLWEKELKNKKVKTLKLENVGGNKSEAGEIFQLTKKIRPEYFVLDGARFGVKFLKTFKERSAKTILVDDNYEANKSESWAVINPNIYAKKELYNKNLFERILAGPDYILLRQDFQTKLTQRRKTGVVLLALGVSGNEDLLGSLKRKIMEIGLKVVIAKNFSAARMIESIDSASLVVCGASVTLHEVWARARDAIPVYQAKDQMLFKEWCLENSIPFATTINTKTDFAVKCIMKLVEENLKKDSVHLPEINFAGADNAVNKLFT